MHPQKCKEKTMANLVGAKIETYLLEQIRIVNPSKFERNYHIFYSMCRGMTDD